MSKIDEVTQRLTKQPSISKCNCAGDREKRWKRSIKGNSSLNVDCSKKAESPIDDLDEEMQWQEEHDAAEEQRFYALKSFNIHINI
jgi:hypothetical protein